MGVMGQKRWRQADPGTCSLVRLWSDMCPLCPIQDHHAESRCLEGSHCYTRVL